MPDMIDYVIDLEARSERTGVSITAICAKAGIARSTFSRWKAGKTEPQMRVYRKLLKALEDAEADTATTS